MSCMIAMRFVDTNIPVYAVSSLPEEQKKRNTSLELLSQGAGNLAISVQVLGEFYFQVTRPSRRDPLTHHEAVAVTTELRRHFVQPLTLETFHRAVQYREWFSLSYWDCLILAAAKLSGCEAVYSEDLSATQDYDGIRVINPFEVVGETTLD